MADFEHISIDGTSYDAVPAGEYVMGVKGSAETNYRHGNVNLSKTNVGLGNVPNVTTNNQTPTFSQATTRANLASGEKLSVLFGKIMKWFADLKTVAFSGSYNDLSNKPTIPTVNNATLTIQRNGTSVGTFTANASSNKTINIIVPNISFNSAVGSVEIGIDWSDNNCLYLTATSASNAQNKLQIRFSGVNFLYRFSSDGGSTWINLKTIS